MKTARSLAAALVLPASLVPAACEPGDERNQRQRPETAAVGRTAGPEADPEPYDGPPIRLFVTTDIGGDPDDEQSLVHLLVSMAQGNPANFDLRGLVPTPGSIGPSRAMEILLDGIDQYEIDYPRYRLANPEAPAPDRIRSVVYRGSASSAPPAGHAATGSPGSDALIAEAIAANAAGEKLYVTVWGGPTELAQALHDEPSIEPYLRVHLIGGANIRAGGDAHAWDYIDENFPDLWLILNDTSFRGMYVGGDDSIYDADTFIGRYVSPFGALGRWCPTNTNPVQTKAGDTPSILYLMSGDPADPLTPSWGGRYVAEGGSRPERYVDEPDPAYEEYFRPWDASYPGARTVNAHRNAFMAAWADAMAVAAGVIGPRLVAVERNGSVVRVRAEEHDGGPDTGLRLYRAADADGSTDEGAATVVDTAETAGVVGTEHLLEDTPPPGTYWYGVAAYDSRARDEGPIVWGRTAVTIGDERTAAPSPPTVTIRDESAADQSTGTSLTIGASPSSIRR